MYLSLSNSLVLLSSMYTPGLSTLNDISISSTADRARQLLLCCQRIQDEEPRRMADWQNDRFNIWASNIGVFASKHSSLDYRLRTAPSAKIAVDGNLYILCTQILRGKHSFLRPMGRTLLMRFISPDRAAPTR